jgi:hypothetical protein
MRVNIRLNLHGLVCGLIALVVLGACSARSNSAELTAAPAYRLSVSRLFGYGSGNQIKGSFRLSIVGAPSIQSVDFLIDGQLMGTVTNAPYQLDFQTEAYSYGVHTLSAVLTPTDGERVETPGRQFEFASAQQEQKAIGDVLIPLGSIVLLVVVLGVGSQFLFMKRRKREFVPLGAARHYGWGGGAICSQCKRPTVLHPFSPHFGFHLKFDFCENCGKWSMMRALPESALRLAEAEERKSGETTRLPQKTEEEKLKEILDESKYTR